MRKSPWEKQNTAIQHNPNKSTSVDQLELSCPAKLRKNIVWTLEHHVRASSEHCLCTQWDVLPRHMRVCDLQLGIALVQENNKDSLINKMGNVAGDTGGWLHRSRTDTFCLPRLNKSDVAPRNRALDPRGLKSPGPIFKSLILSLVSFSQTVRRPLSIRTCCAGRSTHPHMSTFISVSLNMKNREFTWMPEIANQHHRVNVRFLSFHIC